DAGGDRAALCALANAELGPPLWGEMHRLGDVRRGDDEPRRQEPAGAADADDAGLGRALLRVEIAPDAHGRAGKARRIDTGRADAGGDGGETEHADDKTAGETQTHEPPGSHRGLVCRRTRNPTLRTEPPQYERPQNKSRQKRPQDRERLAARAARTCA